MDLIDIFQYKLWKLSRCGQFYYWLFQEMIGRHIRQFAINFVNYLERNYLNSKRMKYVGENALSYKIIPLPSADTGIL